MATNVHNSYEANVRRLSLSYPVTSINHVDASAGQLTGFTTVSSVTHPSGGQKGQDTGLNSNLAYTKPFIRKGAPDSSILQRQGSDAMTRQYSVSPSGNVLGSSSTVGSPHLQRNSIAGTVDYVTPYTVSSGASTARRHYVPNYQQLLHSSPLSLENSKNTVVYSLDTRRDTSSLITSNRSVDGANSATPTSQVEFTVPRKQSGQGTGKEVIKTIPVRSIAKSSKIVQPSNTVINNQLKSSGMYGVDSVSNRRYLLKSMSAVLPGQIAVNSQPRSPKETLTITHKPSDNQSPAEKKTIYKSWVAPETHGQSVVYNASQIGSSNQSKNYATYPVTSSGTIPTFSLPHLKNQKNVVLAGDSYYPQIHSARNYNETLNQVGHATYSSCSVYFPDGQVFMRLPFQESRQLLNALLLVQEKISWFKPLQEKLRNKSTELVRKLAALKASKSEETTDKDTAKTCVEYTEKEAQDLLAALSSLSEMDELFLLIAEKSIQEILRQLPMSKMTMDGAPNSFNNLAMDYLREMGKKLMMNVLEKNTQESLKETSPLSSVKQENSKPSEDDSTLKPEVKTTAGGPQEKPLKESPSALAASQVVDPTAFELVSKQPNSNDDKTTEVPAESPDAETVKEQSDALVKQEHPPEENAKSQVDTQPEAAESKTPQEEPLKPVMSLQEVHKLNEQTLQNSNTPLQNLSTGTSRPIQQEYLYSLTINTGGSLKNSMRCVDVISIHRTPDVLLMNEFLTLNECHDVIQSHEQYLKAPANLKLPDVDNEMIVKLIRRRLATILKLDTSSIEEFKVVKREANEELLLQSLPTNKACAIICLKDVPNGGVIEFKSIGFNLTLKSGTAVVWMNTADTGDVFTSTISPASCTSYFILCKFNKCCDTVSEPNKIQAPPAVDSVDVFKANTRKSQKLPKLLRKKQPTDDVKQPKLQTVEEELTL